MAAEVLFVAAKDDDTPRFLAGTRGVDVPFPALLLSTILVQIMLVVTLFSEDAYNFALDLTSALTLIPFLLAAAYALKLALTRETYTEQPDGRGRELVVGALATLYTAFLLFAAGPKFILVSFIIYAPATILFVLRRALRGRQAPQGPGLRARPGPPPPHPHQRRRPVVRRRAVGRDGPARPRRLRQQAPQPRR